MSSVLIKITDDYGRNNLLEKEQNEKLTLIFKRIFRGDYTLQL